jgi:hypothetical protein
MGCRSGGGIQLMVGGEIFSDGDSIFVDVFQKYLQTV